MSINKKNVQYEVYSELENEIQTEKSVNPGSLEMQLMVAN